MKLYIKQHVFTLSDRYSIFNENQETVFDVQKELFSFPARFGIYNSQNEEVYTIQKDFTLFLQSYKVYKGQRLCASVQKELSLFKANFSIESEYGSFSIDGDIFDWDFSILKNGEEIGHVHKQWFSWGDSYVLTVLDEQNADFFCALVIAIDNSVHNGNK